MIRSRPAARQHGFSLIELIVTIVLLGLVAKVGSSFFADNLSLVRLVNADSMNQADARALLERLAREIRETKYDNGNNKFCVSQMASSAQMVFNRTAGAYINTCGGSATQAPDGSADDYAVTIRWNSSASTLSLGYSGALASPNVSLATLSDQVTSFGMVYRDSSYAITASPAALRYVELTLTLQPPGSVATTAKTVVALRND